MNSILHQFLLKHELSNLQVEFDDCYESHPNFPSLFALTDTFSLLYIENVAANVPKDQLDELPRCFLAYVSNGDKGNDIALIENLTDKVGVTFEGKNKKYFPIDEFKDLWNGVVIAIEPNNENNKVRPKSSFNKIVYLTIAVLGMFLVKQWNVFSFDATISFFLYLLGFVTSIFIIIEKLNQGTESVSKLCSFNENTSCDSVIKSAQTKINNWLDFSDLPILFFSIAIVAMLIDTSSYLILNIVSLLAIPLVIYSVWLQKVKLQKWCFLCLAVSLLLVLQAVLLIKTGFEFKNNISSLLIATVLTVALWFFIRDYLGKNIFLEKSNKELKRFKRNYKVFEMLQKPLNVARTSTKFSTIEIGSHGNPVTLSIALSPSCGHCHTAFEQALALYNSSPNKIKLAIFFNLNPENKNNIYLDVAKSIMQINFKNQKEAVEALSDWHIKKLNLADWMFKWEQINIDAEVIENLQSQYNWCQQNDFNYTPVKMINGKELPEQYNIEEMKYFISEIEEETKPLVLV
ncbi:vitamin K epoxide reductase family protein [Flavobacterium ardleyense]|uniref:Vitamin K epoxide reductase family protein n=1 Tax=Flavobacterium ardleyense TaxID=2038737 RepID=A0ABW5Z8U6_9FLAO